MSRILVFLAGFALLVLAGAGRAEMPSLDQAMALRSMGAADAPVTMTEYSSLGCPHCAAFHRETLPQIKKDYIDTGKLRLVIVDFPLGNRALAAALVARCAPKTAYFGLVDLLFADQQKWAEAGDPVPELKRIARFAGLSGQDVDACTHNDAMIKAVTGRAQEASEKHDIRSTPTFLIDGERVEGAQPYAAFKKAIDAALAKKK